MKGQSPEAHAQAILDKFKFKPADEKKFKETFGYDLRKTITESYRNKDDKTSHKSLGNGFYQTTIPIDKEMLAQIREIKPENKQQAKVKVETKPKSPSNPNEAIAGKNGVNDANNQRTKLDKQLADAENAKMARLINDAQIIPTGITPRKLSDLQTFSVRVPEGTTADQKDKVLLSHIDKQYSDRIPFAQNRQNILAEAKLKGVDIQNVKVENGVATFDISVENMLKLHTSFIGERASINQAEKAYYDFADKNEISQFLSGLVTGSGKAIAGTANLIIDLPGTLNTLYQVVSSPVETFNALYKELGETWDEFKNADSSKKANMIGELVGGAVTEFLIGKGIGKAAGILAKTKTGAALLAKAENTAVAVTAKVAEKFSDEAAALASQRIKQSLRNPTLYSGFAGGELIGDFAVFAGNKMKNGVIPFKEFVELSVKEYGSNIKGKADELAQGYRQAMQKLGFGNDIVELEIDKTSKLTKYQFQKETTAARQKLFDGIKDAEKNGALQKIKGQNIDDYNWLNQDPRRKELAFDPDTKSFKVNEARAITEAEKQGVIESPTKRGIFDDGKSRGADYIDKNGIEWDMKDAAGGADKIINALKDGENVIVDARGMSEANFKALKSEIELKRPKGNNQVRYVR